MNRRSFLKTLASGIVVAVAPEILVPERKFWQLDQTMVTPKPFEIIGVAATEQIAEIQTVGAENTKITIEELCRLLDDLYAASDGQSYEYRWSPSLRAMVRPAKLINFNQPPPGPEESSGIVDFLNTPLRIRA